MQDRVNEDLKTKYVGGGIFRHEAENKSYDAKRFLEGLRTDSLPEDFTLSNEAFCELAERLNGGDKELAKEMCGKGILALMSAKKGSGVDGLLVLAEACANG